MTPERYKAIKEVYFRALEEPRERRLSWAQKACAADPDLLKEVQSLLDSSDGQESAIMLCNIAGIAAAAAEELLDERAGIGRRIGAYRLEKLLGEGGMGAVFEAWRADDQFRQRVALKLVKASALSDIAIARFQRERQILADLVHPNIARLIDGGVAPDGRPYLVMEFIDGVPIDRYCRVNELGVHERCLLFREVCSAVQFAHRQLVIHRDLKPGNILVTSDGQVKLLDFGIAKLIDEEEQFSGPLTRTGVRLLTPDYASPEQVSGGPVGTGTDVYSLGVLLYELLTGQLPYDLRGKTLADAEYLICTKDPERPSTLLRRSQAAAGADLQRVRRALEGDLDNIVMMALRKEPGQRYLSVEQFSRDVGNYLENRPVIARTPTLTYRTRKLVLRHFAAFVAAGLVLAAIAAGTTATVWQARIAIRERTTAVRRFNDVRKLARTFLYDFNDSLARVPGSIEARKLIVSKGLEYLDSLAAEAGDDLTLRRELGSGYIRIGNIQGNPVMSNLGDTPGAIASYRKAVAILMPLAHRGDYESRSEFAVSLMRFGDLLWATGDNKASLAQYKRALEIQQQLMAERPSDMEQLARTGFNFNNIGDLYLEANEFDNAEASYGRGLDISQRIAYALPDQPKRKEHLSLSFMKLGDIAWHRGDWQRALLWYQKGTALREELLRDNPGDAILLHFLVASYTSLGDTYDKTGDTGVALREYRKALKAATGLAAGNAGDYQSQRDLNVCRNDLAQLLTRQGHFAEARSLLKASREAILRFVKRGSPSRVMLQDLSEVQDQEARLAVRRGNLEEGCKAHAAARETRQHILKLAPGPESRRELLQSLTNEVQACNQMSARLSGSAGELWRARRQEALAQARALADEIRKQTALASADVDLLNLVDTLPR